MSALYLDTLPRPALVVAVRDGVPTSEVEAACAQGAALVELRIDQFHDSRLPNVLAEVGRLAHLPLLATVRSQAEGGSWRGTDSDRLAVFRAVLPYVKAVDIELSSEGILEDLVAEARERMCLTIGSFHNFESTPPDEHLREVVSRGRACGVGHVKIAAHCTSERDLKRLAALCIDAGEEKTGITIIGMGEHGCISRAFFPALGSRLTYTFLGEPTAPGQLTFADMVKYLRTFYAGFHPRVEDGEN